MSPALKAVMERWRTIGLALLAGGAAGVLGNSAQTAVGPEALAVTAAETAAWSEAQRARTPEAYQRYLELFPVGAHAEEAFRLLIERALERRPVSRLIDLDPPLGPGLPQQPRVVAAADLALY